MSLALTILSILVILWKKKKKSFNQTGPLFLEFNGWEKKFEFLRKVANSVK